MNNIFKTSALLLIFVFTVSLVSSQPWLNEPYIDYSKSRHSFYDIQDAFNSWSSDMDLSELKGINRYKRWEWFYEPRVYPTGQMPDMQIYWDESQKFRSYDKSSRGASNWISLAPASVPNPYDTLNIIGMGRINSITFHPSDVNTLWIGASSGGVWKTTDNGSTWVCLTDMIPALRISDVAVDPNNEDILYIATGDINTIQLGGETNAGVGILKSTDGGANWNTTGLSFNLSDGNSSLIRKILINPTNSNELMAAGVDGIYKSSDAGDNWTKVVGHMIVDVDVNPENHNIIYATSFYNSSNTTSKRIYKSYDFGQTWNELNTGMPPGSTIQRIELAIAPSDTNFLYAITCGTNNGLYAFYKSIDAGQTWFVVSAPDTTIHPGATVAPNVLGWGDGGLSGFLPDDGGQGTYDLTLVVDPDNPDYVYSGGVNMWGTDDGGLTWDIVSMWYGLFGASAHADHHYSIFHPVSGKLYQAHDGGIDVTDSLIIGDLQYVIDSCVNYLAIAMGDLEHALYANCYFLPTQWTNISHGLHITEYYRLGTCRSNSDLIVAGSQDNGTFLYNNGSWVSTLGGDGMEAMIDHDNDQIIYATNYNGALSKSVDGGVTYTSSLEQPITDAGETGAWVTPFIMHPDSSDIIYTGFVNVWKSVNGGSVWTQESIFAGTTQITALAVAPKDPDVICCVRGTNIFLTVDGGTTWANIKADLPTTLASMTYISFDYDNPHKIWVTFSGYEDGEKIYVTSNAGASWTNISGGLPNVPVNCVVHQAGCDESGAVYVGTDIGVFYTNDSLQNTATKWISYNNNFPNVVVSELEIHYGAQVLRAATYGRGLWETPLYSPSNFSNIQSVENNGINLSVFPNPVNEELNIKAHLNESNNIQITIFALNGKKVLSVNDTGKTGYQKTINLKYLSSGTYLIQINIDNAIYSTRFVKE
ncbi:MAG: T9SS type A sorting domain-containing protein [Bacteroidota bacterium]